MTIQLTFYIEINKCINCKSCEMACNKYYNLEGVHRREVVSYVTNSSSQTIHLSLSCNHCRNPICIFICPENNFQKRQDGIVVHNAANCKGCKRCINACPFHAPKINPKTNRADKCNFCVERIDEGLQPICVKNCLTGALRIIKTKLNLRQEYTTQLTDTPIATYTDPSIIISKKNEGQVFFREG